jgi:hypothetical protein
VGPPEERGTETKKDTEEEKIGREQWKEGAETTRTFA